HEDHFGPVASSVARHALDVVAENEGDVLAAELARELASLRQELERESRQPSLHQLDGGPAVVALAGLLAEPVRLVPGRGGALRELEPLADRRRGLLRVRGDQAGPLR